MWRTHGNTNTTELSVTKSEFIKSRRFLAFKNRIMKGKKVTDTEWEDIAGNAGTSMPDLDTRFIICTHPRVNGQSYTSIRITHLKIITKSNHCSAQFAEAELLRRGHTDLPIDVSMHAIDGASNRYWKVWIQNRRAEQGLASWLKEISIQAYIKGVPVNDNSLVREYQGITFSFQVTPKKLKLITIN